MPGACDATAPFQARMGWRPHRGSDQPTPRQDPGRGAAPVSQRFASLAFESEPRASAEGPTEDRAVRLAGCEDLAVVRDAHLVDGLHAAKWPDVRVAERGPFLAVVR